MSNFRTWSLAKLNKRFHLKRLLKMPELSEWEKYNCEISDIDVYFLKKMQAHLLENVFTWNEQELSSGFIGPILAWVNFTTEYTNQFEERAFGAVVDGEELSGEPDAMIAWGRDEPEKPFFCFKEFKKEIDSSGDPMGQCLSAMLAAQEINEYRHHIYGIYVIGQNWHFMVLKGKEYAISTPYSATNDEIFAIYRQLLGLKEKIATMVQQELSLINI